MRPFKGKTIQGSVFLSFLSKFQNVKGPFLIVAPLSTLPNWMRELALWTDFDVVCYYGSQEDREIIRETELYYMSKPKTAGYKVQVVVTSPQMCLNPEKSGLKKNELTKIYWEMMIFDEAHRLKNYNSQLSVMIREDFAYRHCLLMTGTPLQNNVDELWSLLNFIDRNEFESLDVFKSQYGELKEAKQIEHLQVCHPHFIDYFKDMYF